MKIVSMEIIYRLLTIKSSQSIKDVRPLLSTTEFERRSIKLSIEECLASQQTNLSWAEMLLICPFSSPIGPEVHCLSLFVFGLDVGLVSLEVLARLLSFLTET